MTIQIYKDIAQHSDEWLALRCGLLTASEIKNIITPAKLQYASNDNERAHVYEIAAQRITKYTEPTYQSYDMQRGLLEEPLALQLYHKHYAPLEYVGFVTNDKWGFTLGYSPDALTEDGKGQVEVKSRCMKYQTETIIKNEVPLEYMLQIQCGLMVTEREYCDFISYCGGMPMFVKRVLPDPRVIEAIVQAGEVFYAKVSEYEYAYRASVVDGKFYPTERTQEEIRV